MSLVQPTQLPAVLVAIDIAKLRHDVLIEAPGWKNRKRMILPNTAAEFRLFADFLHALKHPVRVVFEATGNYHRPLAHFLQTEGFHLELIASLAVARTREAMHNSWDKNDPKDAQVLLHLLKTGVTQHYHDPLANRIHDFQELSLTCAASTIIVSSSSSVGSISRPNSQASSAEPPSCPSTATHGFAAPSGWPQPLPYVCVRTASGTSSNDISGVIRSVPIASAWLMWPSLPRWRV